MLAGVCNGLAAYLGVDVTLLRLVVAILVFFSFGTVAIAYCVSILIIPQALTPGEKAAATGPAPTAQEFIRRAKEGYYEGFKTMGDREAHRAWKRKFKYEMREWKHRLRREYRWGWWAHPTPAAPFTPPATPVSPTPNMPPPPAPPEGAHVVMPVLSTLKALLLFFCVLGILSLFTTGSLLGIPLPGHMPAWAGIVLVILAYKVVVAPIKAIRRNYYYRLNGWPVYFHPFTEFWLTLLPFVVLAFGLWLADYFIPGFHQALLNIPVFLQNASESIRQWWTQK
jgi:phage shock protein PspC (stress-responsive transcriptional regulator)